MRLEDIRETYFRLTFNEAVILNTNMRQNQNNEFPTLPKLIERMTELEKNTRDPGLKADVCNLIQMLSELTPSDYSRLMNSVLKGELLFPENYQIAP